MLRFAFWSRLFHSYFQDVNLDNCFAAVGTAGNAMETDADDSSATETMETDAMETSAIEDTGKDRTTCFILFRKFIKEVLPWRNYRGPVKNGCSKYS